MPDAGIRPPAERDDSHLAAGELAAFLDDALPAGERTRLEAHLEQCAACRAELVAVHRITDSPRARISIVRNVRWQWWLATAAGLAALLMLPRVFRPGPHIQPVRAGPADGEGRAKIGIVSPAENATIAPSAFALTWHSAAADQYRVSLLTESGDVIWSAPTADTTITPPATLSLRHGEPYFWRVEAIGNGITASSGAHRLIIGP